MADPPEVKAVTVRRGHVGYNPGVLRALGVLKGVVVGGYEKGSSVKSSFEAIRSVIGDSAWERSVAALDPVDAEIIRNPGAHHLVPCAVTGRFYSQVHALVGAGDRNRTDGLLRAAGRRDADSMLDGIFSIFARFVSPLQAFRRAGSIVGSVYSGVEVDTAEDSDGRGGVLTFVGLGEEPFCCCVIAGWMERAIERFGGNDPHVRVPTWDAGLNAADRLEFVVRWGE